MELVFPNLRNARLVRQLAESVERDLERQAASVAATLEMTIREFAAQADCSKSQAAKLIKQSGAGYVPRGVNPAYATVLAQLEHLVRTMPVDTVVDAS